METLKELSVNASKLIFISDIHFGKHVNNEEWQENMRNYFYNFFIPKIKEIKSTLAEGEELVCVNLGDTYDDRSSIDINVSNLSIDVFEDIAKEVHTIIINGNHDLSKKTNKGNTSLRTIELIPNIDVITDPTMITFKSGTKKLPVIAIPYLGDITLESNYLATYSSKAKFAFMHTELSKMKMDNGMLITNGINTDIFKGIILSGHIHKRQESKKNIYVGSPYHLNKSDIGNEKGIYVLDVASKKIEFTKNDYSPIYQYIKIEDFDEMSDIEKQSALNNNYSFIIINEEDLPKYKKKYDIYNLGINTTAKFVKPVIVKKKIKVEIDENVDYREQSIQELINESINQLEIEDDVKNRLYSLSDRFLNDAESELSND